MSLKTLTNPDFFATMKKKTMAEYLFSITILVS